MFFLLNYKKTVTENQVSCNKNPGCRNIRFCV